MKQMLQQIFTTAFIYFILHVRTALHSVNECRCLVLMLSVYFDSHELRIGRKTAVPIFGQSFGEYPYLGFISILI